jgi:S-adenosylmethionine:tRNA ribosyltransferase-isomerase
MSLTNRSTYDYHLPQELIAQYPSEKRDDCRLLFLDKKTGGTKHHSFSELLEYLKPGDVLVINSSKVIPARLFGRKETGASVEVLLLRNIEADRWECLVRPGNKLRIGAKILFSESISAEILEHLDDGLRVVSFSYEGDFWTNINQIGTMPLPPYIKRKANQQDFETYQTVYAEEQGSAAAPTAGLHFTEELLESIKNKGVTIAKVILHVGLDTFRPVAVDNILEHKMHREFCTVSPETAFLINKAKSEGRRIIAVGTTTTRVLESFAENIQLNNSKRGFYLSYGSKWSDIFIYPGYDFRIIDGLITNFHLPESTLLMMISAFAGFENTMAAYKQAIAMKYRFFSYGDAMLIL